MLCACCRDAEAQTFFAPLSPWHFYPPVWMMQPWEKLFGMTAIVISRHKMAGITLWSRHQCLLVPLGRWLTPIDYTTAERCEDAILYSSCTRLLGCPKALAVMKMTGVIGHQLSQGRKQNISLAAWSTCRHAVLSHDYGPSCQAVHAPGCNILLDGNTMVINSSHHQATSAAAVCSVGYGKRERQLL